MRFCNGRTFSQLNPQMIIQTDASLTGWGAVYSVVQTSGQWSEEDRTLKIAIKLVLFSFIKGKRVKAIQFQIDNKAALSYLLKMGGKKNEHMIKLSKQIWHYLLNQNMSNTAEYLPSVLNTIAERESRKKNRLLRLASSSQSFSSGFLTSRFSENRSICFLPIPSTTSVYGLAFRSLQSGDRCNDTKLRHRSSLCISSFQYDFKSAPKNKTRMCSSPDSDCTSLEYPTMVPRTLKRLCHGTSVAALGKRNSVKPKKYCPPIDGGELIDTSGLVGFRKTFSCEGISENTSHIITNSRRKSTC